MCVYVYIYIYISIYIHKFNETTRYSMHFIREFYFPSLFQTEIIMAVNLDKLLLMYFVRILSDRF
jgi:hypothetical protein